MAKKEEPAPLKYGQLPPDAQQIELVKEALSKIQSYGFIMNRAFDKGSADEGVVHAFKVVDEMKTSSLTPIRYNELYQEVLGIMSRLGVYFQDPSYFDDRRIAELYETLQYTTAIVPRLYMLFTVAPAFVKRGHASAKDVMRDLIELARGVQQPTRALFLRHYLLHAMKSVLPDNVSDLEDTLRFVLENFRQMNVLWVRLEFCLDTSTADERKQQRAQLRQLVGSNIQRVSALNALDVGAYKTFVMPVLAREIAACREPLAQRYVIESVIQVFPPEFHIETLEDFFGLFPGLEDEVPTLALVTEVIGRLQAYYNDNNDVDTGMRTARAIARQVDGLLRAGQTFTLDDTLAMLTALMGLTDAGSVNSILAFAENYIQGVLGDSQLDSPQMSRQLRQFLVGPLRRVKNAEMFFGLAALPQLVRRCRYPDRKMVAREVCKAVVRTGMAIEDNDQLRNVFSLMQVLLQRPSDYEETPDDEPLTSDLSWVSCVFQRIQAPDLDATFAMLRVVSSALQSLAPEVKEGLLLSHGEALLGVAVRVASASEVETTVRGILQHFYTILSGDSVPPIPAFWLYLEGIRVSDRFGTGAITVEFFVNAMRLWKTSIADGSVRQRMLLALIKTTTECRGLDGKQYSSVAAELCSSASGVLQKDHQAEAHLLCSHMFNVTREEPAQASEEEDEAEVFKSPDRVRNCLVRALKVATTMMIRTEQLTMFYRVLAHAVYFLEVGVPLQAAWFKALVDRIDQEHGQKGEVEQLPRDAQRFFVNLSRHMKKAVKFQAPEPEEDEAE